MVGVVEICLKVPRVDVLTPLGPQEESFMSYYGHRFVGQGLSVGQVLRCSRFTQPVQLEYVKGIETWQGRDPVPVKPSPSPQHQLCIPMIQDRLELSASGELGRAEWGIILPDVIVDQILQNSWHYVLMPHTRCLGHIFPSATAINNLFLGDIHVEEPELSATSFDNLLRHLQRWAPVILRACEDEMDVENADWHREREALKTMAVWARSCSCLLNGTLPLSAKLCAAQNIDIQILLSHLTSTGVVQEVVDLSVAAVFPGQV